MILLIILLTVFLVWGKFFWFPKKPLNFRLKIKEKGFLKFYRIEVERKYFGWTGFYAFRSDGKIAPFNGWSGDKSAELEYVKTYMDIKGIDSNEYEIKTKIIKS